MGCECELKPGEVSVLKAVFESILKVDRSPTVEELRSSLKKSDEEVIGVLDELEMKDVLLRKRGTEEIVSVYPLSLRPTEHQIIIEDGKRLFGMCAVDALGMPVMFDKNAKIVSRCLNCKQDIAIEIRDEEIAWMSHPNIVIWSPERQIAPAAETCCPLVNFFCSKEHLEEWVKKNPGLVGKISELVQAYPKIKGCWKQYGEVLGFRICP